MNVDPALSFPGDSENTKHERIKGTDAVADLDGKASTSLTPRLSHNVSGSASLFCQAGYRWHA